MAVDILEFLKDKNILVIGVTGFLGKVFIEKILRVQGDVGRIFALLRASDLESAQAKLQNEVFSTELFRPLREHHRGEYERFMQLKVVPVVGDVSKEDLGIEEQARDELFKKVDIIVNSSATTRFYERYDVAINVNAVGAANVVRFGRQCSRLQLLCHVSTAYVNVGRTGVIREEALRPGERLSQTGGTTPTPPEVEAERELMAKTLDEIRSISNPNVDSHDKTESRRMKELAEERARNFGWPNSYVFTKAMAEMLVNHYRGEIPTVIIRPSIIESTLAEPFPGWIEGNRMVDPLLIAYGEGQLTRFTAAHDLVIDLIPVDMVVNGMISIISRHASDPGLFIYHLTTSVENPLVYFTGVKAAYEYFKKYPCKGKGGEWVNIKQPHVLPSMESFRWYMTLYCRIPLEMLHLVDLLLCGFIKNKYKPLLRSYNLVMKLAELYEPFIFFKGSFDSSNTERLRAELSTEDQEKFKFDVKCIDWSNYFYHVHIPGLIKHVQSTLNESTPTNQLTR